MQAENYTKLEGKWARRSFAELDQLCEQQRSQSLLHHERFHYRKKAVVPTYWYWRKQGRDWREAYHVANLTQLEGLKPCVVNLDGKRNIIPRAMSSYKGWVRADGLIFRLERR
jgi:hypothetical protein